MKRIFIDTNFVMDLLVREGEYQNNAIKVLEKARLLNQVIYVSFLSLANFAYITRKQEPKQLYDNLTKCGRLFTVLKNDLSQIERAIELNPNDLEDAIQYETALEGSCECIITRDKEDYEFSQIPIISPIEYLTSL